MLHDITLYDVLLTLAPFPRLAWAVDATRYQELTIFVLPNKGSGSHLLGVVTGVVQVNATDVALFPNLCVHFLCQCENRCCHNLYSLYECLSEDLPQLVVTIFIIYTTKIVIFFDICNNKPRYFAPQYVK